MGEVANSYVRDFNKLLGDILLNAAKGETRNASLMTMTWHEQYGNE
jgi:hypothetical protein